MSSGARLSRLATKEIRALSPVWLACLAAMIAGTMLNLNPFRGFGIAVFFFGSAALGALTLGHEYQHGTLGMLLSLPARRSHLFFVKMAVLAPMLLTIAGVAALLVFPGTRSGEFDRPWLTLRVALYVLCVAPWLTMVFRSAIAGTVFALAMPGTAVTAAQLIYLIAYGRIAPGAFVMTVLWQSSIVLTALGAIAGWRGFMRLEAIDGNGSSLALPQWLRWSATNAAGLTTAEPIWLLLKKELRLQEVALIVAGFYVLGWLAAVSLTPAFPHAKEIFDILSIFYGMLIALLVGSVASAEERQLGTLEWQTLLPVGSVTQWAVKVGLVLGLALLLGLGLPALLVSANPDLAPLWPQLGFGIVALAIAGLYVSSTCGSGLWAMLMSLASVLVAMWALTFLRVRLAMALGRVFRVGLIRFDRGLEHLMATAILVLLLWFALTNHRSADRGSRRFWIQALWLTGSLTAATIVAVLAG